MSPTRSNGAKLTWNYTYEGDQLTKVCGAGVPPAPTTTTTAGSHYRTAVLDAKPDSYYHLGEAERHRRPPATITINLGKDAGTYRNNVTLGTARLLEGAERHAPPPSTAPRPTVDLPEGAASRRAATTRVELWFKIGLTRTGGRCIGYQDKARRRAPPPAASRCSTPTPTADLRGQFATGQIDP